MIGATLALPALAAGAEAPEQRSAWFESMKTRDRVDASGKASRVVEARAYVRDALGVAQFGQLAAPYVEGYSTVAFEDVAIEKPDGRLVKVSGKVEDLNPFGMSAWPVPADLRLRRLTLPGLEAGDRLRYRIVIEQKPIFPGHAFGEVKFLPAALGSNQVYELDLPADQTMALHIREGLGAQWEDAAGPAGRRVRRLVMPAAGSDVAEYEKHAAEPDAIFTTFSKWDEVASWWWGLSRERMRPDAAVRAEADRLAEGRKEPREKLEAIHAFVAGKIRYLNVGFGVGRMQPRPATEVLASRYGDCKDKHALVAAMAAVAGVEVRPALLHSSRPTLLDPVPSPGQFDHVLSVALLGPEPTDWLWFDSTTQLAPFGYLLPGLRGKRALVVGPDGSARLVSTPERPPYSTRIDVETSATLDASGPLRAHVRWSVRSDDELQFRVGFLATPPEKRDELGRKLAKEWTKGTVSNVASSDPSMISEPFRMDYEVEHKMGAETFEKDWDLWLPVPKIELPEVSEEDDGVVARLTGPDEFVVRASCELPDGMKAAAPLSVTLERPFAVYRSTYSVEARSLRVERVLQIRRRAITADDAPAYESFREALQADRRQEFPIAAFHSPTAAPASADSLYRQGAAALKRGDHAAAEQLLGRVVALEPRHKRAWNDLGRALRRLDRSEQALAAFAKQIEVNPFDEYAWADRGELLFELGRDPEAERDLQRQIEIAPLRSKAYRLLARLRVRQERRTEAAELLSGAVRADPDDSEAWSRLAWLRLQLGQHAEAHSALDRAVAIGNTAMELALGAQLYEILGDDDSALRAAEAALPTFAKEFNLVTADDVTVDDVELVSLMGDSWRIIGEAALQAGDLPRADGFLSGAWQATRASEVAVLLARVREQQQRPAAALDLLAEGAAAAPAGRPNPAGDRLAEVERDRARCQRLIQSAKDKLMTDRILALPGPVPGHVQGELLLLFDAEGRAEGFKALGGIDGAMLDKLRPRLIALSLPVPQPDGRRFKHPRRAVLACSTSSSCAVVLDQPHPARDRAPRSIAVRGAQAESTKR